MSPWKLIKGLKFKQLVGLTKLFFKHPFFMFSTVRATFSVMKIAQKEFPDIHGKLNKANAFRHALWNILIAEECAKFSKNINSILDWTKEITDWHEEFSPNEALAKVMDLHNNDIGRKLYRRDAVNTKRNKFINSVKMLLEDAAQILSVKDVEQYPNQLVYIED